MAEVLPIPAPPTPTSYDITFSIFTPPPGGVKQNLIIRVLAVSSGIVLSLATSFIPLPLCNPLLNTKYTSGISNCQTITSCPLATLFANYCVDENMALSCVDNYFMSESQTCIAGCNAGTPRSPGSHQTNGICNYDCSNTSNCPSNSLAQMADFPNNYRCSNNYTRINYTCQSLVNNLSKIFKIVNYNFFYFSGSFCIEMFQYSKFILDFFFFINSFE